MQRIGRMTLATAALAAAMALPAYPATADTLADQCATLDANGQTDCRIERPKGREWALTTRVEVGSGRKASVEAVEERFCAAAQRARVAGRVTRLNSLSGTYGEGARLEWFCEPPAVSADAARSAGR